MQILRTIGKGKKTKRFVACTFPIGRFYQNSLSCGKNVFLYYKTDTMSKFGELIDANAPILLSFYTDWNDPSVQMHAVLRDVAAAMGDAGKVVKIDVDKNPKLAEALRVKGLPTLMIYKSGDMVWRQSGEQDANTLIVLMKDFV
tara:strand:+ start:45 stop:476 length:432 start_codon:yes stop_codon:yes gene_type:complete